MRQERINELRVQVTGMGLTKGDGGSWFHCKKSVNERLVIFNLKLVNGRGDVTTDEERVPEEGRTEIKLQR